MPILAVLPIGALPEPTILPIFHRIQEEFADDGSLVGHRLRPVLLLDHAFQLILIPLLHIFVLSILAPDKQAEDKGHKTSQQFDKPSNYASRHQLQGVTTPGLSLHTMDQQPSSPNNFREAEQASADVSLLLTFWAPISLTKTECPWHESATPHFATFARNVVCMHARQTNILT